MSKKDIVKILQEIHDEADHILGTTAENPYEIARIDAREIKSLAKKAITKVNKED
jgi:hypothetical protein